MREQDPTRIPALVAALQEAWEGQPDLTLPAFLGMLHTRGLTWASSEEELLALLAQLREERPARIVPPLHQPVLATTLAPRLAVTLTGDTAVVRSAEDPQRPPAVWAHTGFRPTGPGRPLIVTDAEGVEHRLGVVEAVRPFAQPAVPPGALRQDAIGAARWLVLFDAPARALIGPRVRLWESEGRRTRVETLAWGSVDKLAPGERLQITPAGGGKPILLGRVERVLLVEA